MPKSFNEALADFEEFKRRVPDTKLDLPSYAKYVDSQLPEPQYTAAYKDGKLKRLNAWIDRGVEGTGLPYAAGEAGGFVGSGADELFGTGDRIENVTRDVARALPRMAGEIGLTAIAPEAGLPMLAARVGKVAGYGSAALQGYSNTDSVAGAVISAATLGALPPAMKYVGEGAETAVGTWLGRTAEGLQKARALPVLAKVGAEEATAAGLSEVSRQASLSVGPNKVGFDAEGREARDPFTVENVTANLVGTLAFAPKIAWDVVTAPRLQSKMVRDVARETEADRKFEEELMQPPTRSQTAANLALTSLKSMQKAGASEEVMASHRENLRQAVAGLGSKEDVATDVIDEAKNLQTVNRMSGRPDEFPIFKAKIYELIDRYNDAEPRLRTPEGGPGTGVEQSWHPNAVDSKLVKDLQNKGKLPQITEQKVQELFNFSFDRAIGEPETAARIVTQSMANYLLDRVPDAVKARNAEAKAETSFSNAVRSEDFQERLMIDALEKMPDFPVPVRVKSKAGEWHETETTFLKALIRRLADVRAEDTLDIHGRPHSRLRNFREALIQAANTFDPETQTFRFIQPKYVLKADGGYTVSRDFDGNVVKNSTPHAIQELLMTKGKDGQTLPFLMPLPLKQGEGGLSTKELPASPGEEYQGVKQFNPDDLTGESKDVAFDENDPKTMSELAGGDFNLLGGNDAHNKLGLLGQMMGKPGDVIDKTLTTDKPSETVAMETLAKTLRIKLDEAGPKGLWEKTKDMFLTSTMTGGFRKNELNDFRQENIALALEAALESQGVKGDGQIGPKAQEFIDKMAHRPGRKSEMKMRETPGKTLSDALGIFFAPSNMELPTVSTSQFGNAMFEVIRRVAGDEAVKPLLDRGNRQAPSRSAKAEDLPFVDFSGPVRLQRWVDAGQGNQGAVTPDKSGTIPTRAFEPLLRRLGVTADEVAMYKEFGLDKVLTGERVSVSETIKWMRENTPEIKVTIEKYIPPEVKSPKGQDRMNEIQHQMETAGYGIADDLESVMLTNIHTGEDIEFDQLPRNLQTLAAEYGSLVSNDAGTQPDIVGPKGTSWHDISSVKIDDENSGYFEMAVHLPSQFVDPNKNHTKVKDNFRSPHGFPDNTLAHVRGRLAEIDGQKVLVLEEVQGDWAQQKTRAEQSEIRVAGRPKAEVVSHPLLSVYEQLGLKAVIKYAKQIGAKKVMVPDAETVMMTEEHDLQGRKAEVKTTDNSSEADDWAKAYGGVVKFIAPNKYEVTIPGRPIPQESGMRAAYDDRLPNMMEKLTGRKGQPLEVGEHAKGPSSVFKGKNTVTGRAYDVDSAFDQYSAFSNTRPTVKPGTVKQEYTDGSIAFWSHDSSNSVEKTGQLVKESSQRIWGDKGYDGSLRDYLSNLTVNLVKHKWESWGKPEMAVQRLSDEKASGRGGKIPDTNIGLLAIHPVDPTTGGRAPELRDMLEYIQVIQHEMTHIEQQLMSGGLKMPDAYSDQRYRQLRAMQDFSVGLTPEERHDYLNVLKASMLPDDLKTTRYDFDQEHVEASKKLLYGSKDPNEFVAELSGYVSMFTALAGKPGQVKSVTDVLSFLDPEIQHYIQGTFRNLHDVLDASAKLFALPETAGMMGLEFRSSDTMREFYTGKNYKNAILGAEAMVKLGNVDAAVASTKAMMAGLEKGLMLSPPRVVPTGSVWYGDKAMVGKDLLEPPSASSKAAITEAHESLFGDTTAGGTKLGALTRYLWPFTNQMHKLEKAGFTLAGDVVYLANDVAPAIGRINTQIMQPFLAVGPDGRYNYNEASPLIQMNTKDPRGAWRQSFNRVRQWQNAYSLQAFETTKEGAVQPTAKFAKRWEALSKGLSDKEIQGVMASSVAFDQVYANARTQIEGAVQNRTRNRVARMLQTSNRQMTYEQATAMADQVLNVIEPGVMSPSQYQKPDPALVAQLNINPKLFETIEGFLIGRPDEFGDLDGLLPDNLKLRNHLESRKFFSTEALVGDWIIRYKNNLQEIKYVSGKSESHAKQLAKGIQEDGGVLQGPIVHKKDLKKYSEFDDPAEVLEKFSDAESSKWNSLLIRMEKDYGPAVVADLRDSYIPGAVSMGEIHKKGLKGFMQTNKGQVDLTRYDYIEGTLQNYVPRLSATLANSMARDKLSLILNDPRVRDKQQFIGDVKEHFDFVFAPQSANVREFKSHVVAYYLAANLSSAAVELIQSPISLVPWLISEQKSGGAMKAYKTMISGGSKAFEYARNNDWQKIAKAAGSVLPKNHTEEQALAVVYQDAIKNGAITHGAISDIADTIGQDQAVLANKKFGSGDHVDTTPFTLARNGLYTVNQAMMRLYSWASTANTKIAIMASAKQGFENDLRGKELYDYAIKMRNLTTAGGGKANAPGFMPKWAKSDSMRAGLGIAMTLQSFGLNMVATYSALAQDAIGKSPGLTAAQKSQSRKALGALMITQVAIGGALSVPFAGAALALLEKQFGIPANEAVREALASLAGDDEELGALFSDTFMGGGVAQLTGLDVSSRVGVSNLFGFNAYNGFNAQDVFGPVGGMIGNMVKATNQFGQNNPVQATRSLAPAFMKNVIDSWDTKRKYGDYGFRDQSQNLIYQPTNGEAAAYAMGFRPKGLAQRRLAQSMKMSSDARYEIQKNREWDELALNLLKGDPTPALVRADETFEEDPSGQSRSALLRSLLDRAEDMVVEKDLLASGPRGNAEGQRNVARLVGQAAVPRRSEQMLFQLRSELAMALGEPQLIDKEALSRAALMDELLQPQGASGERLTRSQALQMAKFLGQ